MEGPSVCELDERFSQSCKVGQTLIIFAWFWCRVSIHHSGHVGCVSQNPPAQHVQTPARRARIGPLMGTAMKSASNAR
eukprot:scaffold328471_cov49-Prasinocladus_malaysianus.AAC.1